MTHSQRPRCLLGFRKSLAPVIVRDDRRADRVRARCSGRGRGQGRGAAAVRPPGPLGDRARRSAPRGHGRQSVRARGIVAHRGARRRRWPVSARAPDPDSPVTHIAPAQEGIHVAIPAGSAAAKKVIPEAATAGYQSNSWRQRRPDAARALSFSSGVLAPGVGLDPALKAHADGLRAAGPRVRLRLSPAARPARRGRSRRSWPASESSSSVPTTTTTRPACRSDALEAIAALPEVEWVGVSAPEQKQSLELAELRGPRAKAAGIDRATPIPIVINLFEGDEDGSFRRELEAAGAALGEYDADLHFYRAVATGPVIDADRRPRLRAVRRADRADVRRPRPEHAAHRRRHDPPGQHLVRPHAIQRRLDPGRHPRQRLHDGHDAPVMHAI